jgi:hypothetical protein
MSVYVLDVFFSLALVASVLVQNLKYKGIFYDCEKFAVVKEIEELIHGLDGQ